MTEGVKRERRDRRHANALIAIADLLLEHGGERATVRDAVHLWRIADGLAGGLTFNDVLYRAYSRSFRKNVMEESELTRFFRVEPTE